MPHTMHAARSALILIDYQERLMPAIDASRHVLATTVMLAKTARLLGIPVIGTEHAPTRLGPTLPAVAACHDAMLVKTHFDACAGGLPQALERAAAGREQLVLAGCETHVCLLQTALGLLASGKQVFVVDGACGARRPRDHMLGLERLARAGATIASHDMVAFEWLHDSEHPHFRDVLALVKQME